ncbi:MAG: 30S ribosomal protein S16 [Pseudomonadota bacterium]
MATVIRFSRRGSKKKPIYRIVVQHNQAPRDGKFIEHIGNFNPIKGADTLTVHRDRLEYWLSVGAQMSDSVRNTLKPKLKEWQASAPVVAKAPKAPKAPKEKKAAAPKKTASATKKAAPSKSPEA